MEKNKRFEEARKLLTEEEDRLLRQAAADFIQEMKQKYPGGLEEFRRRARGELH